ncbi:MAG TPA: tail fiber protein [Bacteroidota bacterium]|nr:tail fiber protein [Bacteroidota bacterium]
MITRNRVFWCLTAMMLLLSRETRAQSEIFLGEIRMTAATTAPSGWYFCQGQTLPITQYTALFSLLGTYYGGNGSTTFGLPDLRGRVPVGYGQGTGLSSYTLGQTGGVESVTLTVNQIPSHTHSVEVDLLPGTTSKPVAALLAKYPGIPSYGTSPAVAMSSSTVTSTGSGQSHTNIQPYLAVNYMIAAQGVFPQSSGSVATPDAYVGEIRLAGFDVTPVGWVDCNGQLLSVSTYSSLFGLIGTTYGGDGVSTFAVPDLRSRVPLCANSGGAYAPGDTGGEESHTLTVSEMPKHTHSLGVSSAVATTTNPMGAVPARNAAADLMYGATSGGTMGTAFLTTAGGGQSHENRQPFLALHFIICVSGVTP